jgi:oxygen-independent coproporphyrinogen-3 oxidase
MAGIYIHIPFCRKACNYCNFHFSTTHHQIEPMMEAIEKEIVLQKDYLSETIDTVYFGGGTPSILTIAQLAKLLNTLRTQFTISPTAEITLEANPDDINSSKLLDWKLMGINRLSIGVQSFDETDLLWMNRAHTAAQATNCIQLAKEVGFDNITIDLIYGSPVLTDEAWKKNVDTALAFGIPHLSCYALTVEPKTALDKLIQKKEVAAVDPDKQAHHFILLLEWLSAAGFEHYEISNFALPGHRSKHNSNYWQGKDYLGIGPSAHSFNGKTRQWNVANNSLYLQSLAQNTVPFEIEILSIEQQLNEYIMTSLRTLEGLSLVYISTQWGESFANIIEQAASDLLIKGYANLVDNNLVLTNNGKLMADGIASDLFFVG